MLSNNKCLQMHICEPQVAADSSQSIMLDVHDLPSESFTMETLDLMKKYSVDYITCEYYKDKDLLCKYLSQLRSLIEREA